MDQDQSVEVMLRNMENIQYFDMEIPGRNRKFPGIVPIDYAMAQLMDTGIYTKSI